MLSSMVIFKNNIFNNSPSSPKPVGLPTPSGTPVRADVNVFELATNTSRFSGAEIAGVVRSASSYALERYQLQIGQGGRKQGGTGCWCPPTFHRPLQFVYSIIVCVHVCGDFTILHFTCTTNHKIHDHTCNF